jgi:hypothetical protein
MIVRSVSVEAFIMMKRVTRSSLRVGLNACIILLATLISQPSAAGEAVGTIEFLQVGHGYTPDNAYVLVQIIGQRIGAPSCAIDPRLAVNPNTAAGKAIMATLLAAKAAGSSVRIYGNGTCDVMGTEFESINYVRLL